MTSGLRTQSSIATTPAGLSTLLSAITATGGGRRGLGLFLAAAAAVEGKRELGRLFLFSREQTNQTTDFDFAMSLFPFSFASFTLLVPFAAVCIIVVVVARVAVGEAILLVQSTLVVMPCFSAARSKICDCFCFCFFFAVDDDRGRRAKPAALHQSCFFQLYI